MYKLPSRARSDKGGENYDVGWYMVNRRGTGCGSMIAGKMELRVETPLQ